MYTTRRILKGLGWLIWGNAAQRRRSRHECARIAASLFGDFPLGEDHKAWRDDDEFLSAYRRLSPGNPYSQERKYLLREFARHTRGIAGEMAECGCYEGASAYFMAEANPGVTLHLFDSFEGLSSPGELDAVDSSEQIPWSRGDLRTAEDLLRENLAGFEHIAVYRGWIPERFDEVAERRFRLVHIDVDLYQPTLDSLEFFYPRTTPGGIIILDDYGFTTCPGAFRSANEFMADKEERILHLPTGQGLIIKSAAAPDGHTPR